LRVAVIQFPGSNCDLDTAYVLKKILNIPTDLVWHKFFKSSKYDAVILPGGFSYGDYLRAGVIAAHSPAMKEVKEMAKEGKPVLGICNGFQILIESELLPGALLPNNCLMFVCKWVRLKCETSRTVFTNLIPEGSNLYQPIAHQEGRYYNDEKSIREMVANKQIVFRYVNEKNEATPEANPNGSIDNIAGVCNLEGNVVGLMPHPERSSEKILSPYGSDDGLKLFQSLIAFLEKRGK
jgi:phosphoribosylformylglycinamidine synthase